MPYMNSIFGNAVYWGLAALVILMVIGGSAFAAGHFLIIMLGLFLFNTLFETLSFFVKWGGKAKEIANIVFYSFFALVFFLTLLGGSTSLLTLFFMVLTILGVWYSVYKLRNTTIPSKEYKKIH